MSFRILRGFLNTAAYDSKIIVGGKLKAGWRCITECFDEFAFYTAVLFPFVVAGNHYAYVKPTLEHLEREVLEGHNSVTRVLWTREDTDVFGRRMEAFERRMEENNALKLQIEKLKEELKKRQDGRSEI